MGGTSCKYGDVIVVRFRDRCCRRSIETGRFRAAGVNRDHGRLAVLAEAARVAVVNDRAAGIHHDRAFFRQSDRQMFPTEQIRADRVPPAHVPPQIAERIVLIEDVPLAVVIDKPVRVVRPMDRGSEMELRPIGLLVSRRLRRRGGGRKKGQ